MTPEEVREQIELCERATDWIERPTHGGWWEFREDGCSPERILVSGDGAIVATDDEWEQATGRSPNHDGRSENYWEGTDTTQEYMPGRWRFTPEDSRYVYAARTNYPKALQELQTAQQIAATLTARLAEVEQERDELAKIVEAAQAYRRAGEVYTFAPYSEMPSKARALQHAKGELIKLLAALHQQKGTQK